MSFSAVGFGLIGMALALSNERSPFKRERLQSKIVKGPESEPDPDDVESCPGVEQFSNISPGVQQEIRMGRVRKCYR